MEYTLDIFAMLPNIPTTAPGSRFRPHTHRQEYLKGQLKAGAERSPRNKGRIYPSCLRHKENVGISRAAERWPREAYVPVTQHKGGNGLHRYKTSHPNPTGDHGPPV